MDATSSCVAANSGTVADSNDGPIHEDESIPNFQLRMDGADPYAQNLNDPGLREYLFEESIENDQPYIGMEFGTDIEAYHFYNAYAERGWGSENGIRHSNKLKTPEKVKAVTRIGCQASRRIRLVDGTWKVSVFKEEHNHPLITSPSKKRNLRSQKGIPPDVAAIVRTLSSQNVGPSQILEYVATLFGGKKNLPFKKQDTWIKAMYGKHPKTIITDQDPAMKKAIEIVFPNTVHRCCQWHVMRKTRENLGPTYDPKNGWGKKLGEVINRSLSVPEFVERWNALLKEYKLHDLNHLTVMFSTKSHWVPAYFRGHFFADMSTTQRSESMNALFKIWVNNHTSIYQFVMRIEKMIEGIWQRESDEDLKSVNEQPRSFTPYKMEVQAREIYTRVVFSVFKEIIKESLLGFVTELNKDALYRVDITYHPNIPRFEPESYVVEVDKDSETVSCNCKGFEFEGLLCSHAIKVMHHIGMLDLPSKYILKRWTKNANESVKRAIKEKSMDQGGSEELQTIRLAAVKEKLMKFAKMGVVTLDHFQCLNVIVDEGMERLSSLPVEKVPKEVVKVVESGQYVEEDSIRSSALTFFDPPESQCKGKKKKPTRFKTTVEKKAKKMRTCSICNAKAGHNARTCPQNEGNKKRVLDTVNETSSSEDSEDNEESEQSL